MANLSVEERIQRLEEADRKLESEVRRALEERTRLGSALERIEAGVTAIHKDIREGSGDSGGILVRLARLESRSRRVDDDLIDIRGKAERLGSDFLQLETRTSIASRVGWLIVAAAIGALGYIFRGSG